MSNQKWRKYRNPVYEKYGGHKNSDVLFASKLNLGDLLVEKGSGRQAMVVKICTHEKHNIWGWADKMNLNKNETWQMRRKSKFYPNDERDNSKYKLVALQYLTTGHKSDGELGTEYLLISDTQERTHNWNRTYPLDMKFSSLEEYSELEKQRKGHLEGLKVLKDWAQSNQKTVMPNTRRFLESKMPKSIHTPKDLYEFAKEVIELDEFDISSDEVENWSDIFNQRYAYRFDLTSTLLDKDWYYQTPEELAEYDFKEDKFAIAHQFCVPKLKVMVVGDFDTGMYVVFFGDLQGRPQNLSRLTINSVFGANGEIGDGVGIVCEPKGSRPHGVCGVKVVPSNQKKQSEEGGE